MTDIQKHLTPETLSAFIDSFKKQDKEHTEQEWKEFIEVIRRDERSKYVDEICDIIVKTDWEHHSSIGVNALSRMAEEMYEQNAIQKVDEQVGRAITRLGDK